MGTGVRTGLKTVGITGRLTGLGTEVRTRPKTGGITCVLFGASEGKGDGYEGGGLVGAPDGSWVEVGDTDGPWVEVGATVIGEKQKPHETVHASLIVRPL